MKTAAFVFISADNTIPALPPDQLGNWIEFQSIARRYALKPISLFLSSPRDPPFGKHDTRSAAVYIIAARASSTASAWLESGALRLRVYSGTCVYLIST